MEDNSIIIFRDYGKVDINLKSIMEKNGISETQLVKKTGLHHQVIRRYYNGSIERLDRDVLSRLCYVLNCSLNELICYTKPENKKIQKK